MTKIVYDSEMNFIEFKLKLSCLPVFSLSDIAVIASNFNRNQLTFWLNKGYIKKIKNGVYYFSDLKFDDAFLYELAAKAYDPSYISLETALSYYGFIPESVYQITSVTTRKTQTIHTQRAVFMYRHVKPSLFFGYSVVRREQGFYKLADPEKAIIDMLYLNANLATQEALEEMRFNRDEIKEKINWERCGEYLFILNSKTVYNRFNMFKGMILNAKYS